MHPVDGDSPDPARRLVVRRHLAPAEMRPDERLLNAIGRDLPVTARGRQGTNERRVVSPVHVLEAPWRGVPGQRSGDHHDPTRPGRRGGLAVTSEVLIGFSVRVVALSQAACTDDESWRPQRRDDLGGHDVGRSLRATARPVGDIFELAMARHGVPEALLTDNGKVFTARFGHPMTGTGALRPDLQRQRDHAHPRRRRGRRPRPARSSAGTRPAGRILDRQGLRLARRQVQLDVWLQHYNRLRRTPVDRSRASYRAVQARGGDMHPHVTQLSQAHPWRGLAWSPS